jgi:hypothetical protein
VTGHSSTLYNPCRPGRATDGTGFTMVPATVGLRAPGKPVALDGSGESTSR